MSHPYLVYCATQQLCCNVAKPTRCVMKMTDQMERDYLQAELASGRVNLSEISDASGLKIASAVIGLLLLAAILMIWLGR